MAERNAASIADIEARRLKPADYAVNFSDLHPPLSGHEALVESDRCYFCYDAPCVQACPTSIDIPLFIRQIATGLPEAAAKTIFDQNILGGMCARVCPTETLCEQACVRQAAEDRPVRIGQLQRYATDEVIGRQPHPYARAAATGKRVAVVGAGPAGLACAHRLALHGHEVVIFEARPKPGGLNEYGIAAYKAVDDFAAREVAFILGIGGITIKTGQQLGRDIQIKDLQQDFNSVFLGVGLAGVNRLHLAGEDAEGIVDAVDYIAKLRQAADKADLPIGRRVLVIGGGMTAIDIAIQSRLLGSEEVTILYRRGATQMKASHYEQHLAKTKGVTIRHWLAPKEILTTGGRVTGLRCDHMVETEGKLQASGRVSEFAADMIFKAIGQTPLETKGLSLALENGRIHVDAERRTSLKGLWAGGDCVAGGEDLTVAAVDDGRRAAESIHASLMGQGE